MTDRHVPLIERFRERLPFAEGDPLVSLQEGSTPLLRAPVLSELVGAWRRFQASGIPAKLLQVPGPVERMNSWLGRTPRQRPPGLRWQLG